MASSAKSFQALSNRNFRAPTRPTSICEADRRSAATAASRPKAPNDSYRPSTCLRIVRRRLKLDAIVAFHTRRHGANGLRAATATGCPLLTMKRPRLDSVRNFAIMFDVHPMRAF